MANFSQSANWPISANQPIRQLARASSLPEGVLEDLGVLDADGLGHGVLPLLDGQAGLVLGRQEVEAHSLAGNTCWIMPVGGMTVFTKICGCLNIVV